jgi:hypothetical protein
MPLAASHQPFPGERTVSLPKKQQQIKHVTEWNPRAAGGKLPQRFGAPVLLAVNQPHSRTTETAYDAIIMPALDGRLPQIELRAPVVNRDGNKEEINSLPARGAIRITDVVGKIPH